MNDACSAEVIVARKYDAPFGPTMQGIVLKRGANQQTTWSEMMPVHGHDYFRWWCHSTDGNWIDPGTWRLDGGSIGASCTGDWDEGGMQNCSPAGSVDLSSSAQQGWTPERSRCSSPNTRAIRAILGQNRKLQFECLE